MLVSTTSDLPEKMERCFCLIACSEHFSSRYLFKFLIPMLVYWIQSGVFEFNFMRGTRRVPSEHRPLRNTRLLGRYNGK